MSDHILALSLILAVMYLGVARGSSFYSPLFINAFSWLVVFLPSLALYDEFYPLTETTINAWLIWFSITSVCFFFLQPSSLDNVHNHLEQPSSLPWRYYLMVAVLVLWLSYRIWVVGNIGPNHFFLNLRLASNGIEGYESLGGVQLLYPFVTALFIFEQLNYDRKRRAERWWLFFWLLLFAVGTMGKFAILTPIFIWAIVAGMQKRISLLKLAQTALISIVLMLSAHFIRAGEGSKIDLLEMLAVYTYSPIVAFGYVDIPEPQNLLENSLRFLYAIGFYINISNTPPTEVILSYTAVPHQTNVYSVLYPFYADLGMMGVVVFSMVYGLIFGVIYSLANQKNSIYLAIYVSMSMVLLSQFIGETLFTVLSSRIQTIIYLCVIYYLSKREVHD